jgi:peptidoglycan/LPS O-acetylase OafA/YrhL
MTGVYAFRFDSNRTLGNLVVLILMSISAALTTSFGNVQITVAASLTAILFLCPLFVTSVRNILSSSLLLFFGFISYPLYLIHQNIVTGLAIKLHNLLPSLPPYIYPVPFIILVVLVAFILAKLEPSLKFAIERFVPIRFLGFKILKRK